MARLAKNEVNDGRAMLVEVRSTEGLGVTGGTATVPDVFATVRSTVAVFEPCAARRLLAGVISWT